MDDCKEINCISDVKKKKTGLQREPKTTGETKTRTPEEMVAFNIDGYSKQ